MFILPRVIMRKYTRQHAQFEAGSSIASIACAQYGTFSEPTRLEVPLPHANPSFTERREADKLEGADGDAAPLEDGMAMTNMNDKTAAVCVIDASGIIRMANRVSMRWRSLLAATAIGTRYHRPGTLPVMKATVRLRF